MHRNLEGREQKGDKAELLAGVKNMEPAKVAMVTNEANKNRNPNLRGEVLPSLVDFKGRNIHFPPFLWQAMLRCCQGFTNLAPYLNSTLYWLLNSDYR